MAAVRDWLAHRTRNSHATEHEPIHLFHIGKTAGTALKQALLDHPSPTYSVLLHGHGVTLADVPAGEKFMFVIRDPLSRFVSGFNGRLRETTLATTTPGRTGSESLSRCSGHPTISARHSERRISSGVRRPSRPCATSAMSTRRIRSGSATRRRFGNGSPTSLHPAAGPPRRRLPAPEAQALTPGRCATTGRRDRRSPHAGRLLAAPRRQRARQSRALVCRRSRLRRGLQGTGAQSEQRVEHRHQ